jgi:hypothetical protein
MYTPIIRNRPSEVRAIRELTIEIKAHCTPLVDLAAPSKKKDKASAQAYIERNIRQTVKALKDFENVLVDSSELDPALRISGNKHPLVEAASAVIEAGSSPIPVTGIHRDESHAKAALKIKSNSKTGLICFRLDATDIATASSSYKHLQKLLSDSSLNSADVILLLDLQSVYGEQVESLVAQVSRFIAQIVLSQWAGLIVAGYGIPDRLADAVAVRAQGYIPRVERSVYLGVKKACSIDKLWFGDYTTLSPTHVELDGKLMSKVMSPRAVYALTESWFVVRGAPFSKDGYGQYHHLAAEIGALEEFSGPEYSFGDNYIHECATKAASTGSPASWITACVNHHITLSAEIDRG